MRLGNNPLRFEPAPDKIKDIVFLVVTHLPDPIDNNNDYHGHRFEVVKTCLETMRNNSKRNHTFFVWDNGSEDGFRQWLQTTFQPDMLMLSMNIGKNNARYAAINMLPLSSIVCYSDDDIYYEDNWLNPQIDLLSSFPNVACVSGYPVRTSFRWGNENTMKWAKENGKVTQGRFISKEYESDYANSIGRDPQQHVEMTVKDIDYKISYEGKEAYLTSHHCQFIGYTVKVRQALFDDGMAMGDEKITDVNLDKVGLRLCTTKRYTRHIGNVLDDSFTHGNHIANVDSVER